MLTQPLNKCRKGEKLDRTPFGWFATPTYPALQIYKFNQYFITELSSFNACKNSLFKLLLFFNISKRLNLK